MFFSLLKQTNRFTLNVYSIFHLEWQLPDTTRKTISISAMKTSYFGRKISHLLMRKLFCFHEQRFINLLTGNNHYSIQLLRILFMRTSFWTINEIDCFCGIYINNIAVEIFMQIVWLWEIWIWKILLSQISVSDGSYIGEQ